MSERQLGIMAEEPGGRLDVVLAEEAAELSRSRWQRLIKAGKVRVNGVVIEKPSYELTGGEQIRATIPAPAPTDLQPEDIPLDVIYEDERMLVLNKAAGMVVHPGAGHQTGTLVHAVLAHAPDIKGVGGRKRPGLVHRLDKDTSGVIVLAKDDQAHQHLQRQFKERTVHKEYLALVDGQPPTPSGRVEAPIGRDPQHRKRMAVVVGDRGRPANTTFHTEASFAKHSLLRLHPESGRTHQIRVHLAFLECPVVGDEVYGRSNPTLPVDRQMLHAHALKLVPPAEDSEREFVAPLPADFRQVLSELGADPKSITRPEGTDDYGMD